MKKIKEKTVRIKIADLEHRIYHDELPKILVERATKLFDSVKIFFSNYSLDGWVNGFRYDMHPEKEIAFWEKCVSKFKDKIGDKAMSAEELKEVWRSLMKEELKQNPIVVTHKEVPFA